MREAASSSSEDLCADGNGVGRAVCPGCVNAAAASASPQRRALDDPEAMAKEFHLCRLRRRLTLPKIARSIMARNAPNTDRRPIRFVAIQEKVGDKPQQFSAPPMSSRSPALRRNQRGFSPSKSECCRQHHQRKNCEVAK